MQFENIISVSGKPGLYKMIANSPKGIIVESLVDKKRLLVLSSQKVSSLSNISIYSSIKDYPFEDIFNTFYLHSKGKTILEEGTVEQLELKFEELLPKYDKNRVGLHDIKKIFSWYNLLVSKDFKPEVQEEEVKEKVPAAKSEKAKTKVSVEEPLEAKPKKAKVKVDSVEEEPKATKSKAKTTEVAKTEKPKKAVAKKAEK